MKLPLAVLRRSPATRTLSSLRRSAVTATASSSTHLLGTTPPPQSNIQDGKPTLRLAHFFCSPPGRSYSSTRSIAAATYPGINRAFPQYDVFGESAVLSIKPVMPTFKAVGAGGVAIDKKGKIMLCFSPRSDSSSGSGGFIGWKEQVCTALSVEEIGLIVNQLPSFAVEVSRRGIYGGTGGVEMSDLPDKVLSFTPGDGATVTFKLDYVKDGVGGQLSPVDNQSAITPMEIIVQAGEFEVIKSLLQQSIPHLLGWNPMMDIAVGFSLSARGNGDGSMGGNMGGNTGQPGDY